MTRKETLNYEFNSRETLGSIACKMFSATQANYCAQNRVEPRFEYFLRYDKICNLYLLFLFLWHLFARIGGK